MSDPIRVHREEVPGRYHIELYSRPAPQGLLCTWRTDYTVEIWEGDPLHPTYQFVTTKKDEAEGRFLVESARLARKWRK